jgi:hypothetical protein
MSDDGGGIVAGATDAAAVRKLEAERAALSE